MSTAVDAHAGDLSRRQVTPGASTSLRSKASFATVTPQRPDSGVAYVARPGGPPVTTNYMYAGYAVAAVLYVGYVTLLVRRVVRDRAGLGAHSRDA